MATCQIVHLKNTTDGPQELRLEPLGEHVSLEPGGSYELAIGNEFGEVEIEASSEGFVVHGWVTRVALISGGETQIKWELQRPKSDAGAAKVSQRESPTTFTRITVDARQLGGLPCVRGLRIPVARVMEMLAGGMSKEQILDAYPDLEPGDIEECLRYAAEAVGERELPLIAPPYEVSR